MPPHGLHEHCSCGVCIPNVFVISLGTMYELQGGREVRSLRDDEFSQQHAAIWKCTGCGRPHAAVLDAAHSKALNELKDIAQGKAPSREA